MYWEYILNMLNSAFEHLCQSSLPPSLLTLNISLIICYPECIGSCSPEYLQEKNTHRATPFIVTTALLKATANICPSLSNL